MRSRGRWRSSDFAALGGLVTLAVIATWAVWVEICGRAIKSEDDSHIWLAIPVAAWLAWTRRTRLVRRSPEPSYWAVAVVGAGVALERVGFGYELDMMEHAGAITVVVGAVTAGIGTKIMNQFRPAIAALLFLLPAPGLIQQRIGLPLQEASAQVSQVLLELLGTPVARYGNALQINGVDVGIAEACNGMRMVTALALISFAFVFSVPMRTRVRLLLLGLSPIVAVVVNVMRLTPTALLYGYSDTDTAELFHDAAGWMALAPALAILWAILWILRWIEAPVDPYPVSNAEG